MNPAPNLSKLPIEYLLPINIGGLDLLIPAMKLIEGVEASILMVSGCFHR